MIDNLKKEFLEFIKPTETLPPSEAGRSILSSVQNDLRRLKKVVWQKYLAIHVFCGALTLFFCPQFGFSPWGGSDTVMIFFMGLGRWACPFFCGSLFLGTSTLVSLFLMKREEIRFLKRKSWVFIPSVAALSFVFLMAVNKFVFFDLEYTLVWVVGAIAASLVYLHLGARLKVN